MSDISGLGEFFCHACTLPDDLEGLRRLYFALSKDERERLKRVRYAVDVILSPTAYQAFNCLCAHCNQPFKGSHEDGTLCGPCFVSGHRGFTCDHYCKHTGAGSVGHSP